MLLANAIQFRVKRLMGGPFIASDIHLLLADLRFYDGRTSIVRELGDFAAHRGTRTQGEVHQTSALIQARIENFLQGNGGFAAKAAFTQADLLQSLTDSLIQAGLFAAADLQPLTALGPELAKYALCAMHGTKIDWKNGNVGQLAIRAGATNVLEMGVSLPIVQPGSNAPIFVNVPVVTTSLPLDTCAGRLRLQLPTSDPDFTVERCSDGLLRYLE